MINDVTDAFNGWLEPLTGQRQTGSYIAGRWVAGSATGLSFSGVVQNATPDDLKVLSEGDRSNESIKIHTVFSIAEKDLIKYMGFEWLVFNVARRYIGNYNKAIAIRQ